MRGSGPKISSVGETELIRLIRNWLGDLSPAAPAGIGDDCAVLGVSRKKQLLTIDPVIRGIHFDNRTPARLAGAKLFKRNLSDIAAMGGRPRAAVVSGALDGRLPLRWLSDFYAGLAAVGRRHGVAVVGGDVARLPGSFVATLALVGEAHGRVLTRSGSRIGDWIYVTGCLGRSLKTGHHLHFEPRLAEGAWLAGRREVRALIDVSDGLAKDLPLPRAPPGRAGDSRLASSQARGVLPPRGPGRRRGLRAPLQCRFPGEPQEPASGLAPGVSEDAPDLHRQVRPGGIGPGGRRAAFKLPRL